MLCQQNVKPGWGVALRVNNSLKSFKLFKDIAVRLYTVLYLYIYVGNIFYIEKINFSRK